MKYKKEIILILDDILDDYYYLWECFSIFEQYIKQEYNSKNRFIDALKEAYVNKYFDFYIGENFNGDEKLIQNFELTNEIIEKLLDYNHNSTKQIRVTTSDLGIKFLNQHR